MKTYVINLERSKDRREYMELLLRPYKCLDIEIVEAVDGRTLTGTQIKREFDCSKYESINLRKVRSGEIGCTLSHQKCYRKIIEEDIQSAMIFEDDLIINENFAPIIPAVEKWLFSAEPRLLLLPGWFWYSSTKNFDSSHRICHVIGGFLTHSYALNLSAAKLMLDERPWYAADSWSMSKGKLISWA